MGVIGWIAAIVVALVCVAGLAAACFVSRRRPIADPRDPKVLETTSWSKYRRWIEAGSAWLDAQQTKELQVVSYDGKLLHGLLVECENARGTILLFHGYRSHYLVDFSAVLSYYHSLGFRLLLCDQRSHGQSEGKWITFGVRERFDVLSWVTYLSMMFGQAHPLFLDGLSMGASTVLMASDMEFPANVRGIIADCGFTSPGDIIRYLLKKQYHLPAKPVAALINVFTTIFAGFSLDRWSTQKALQNARYPVLFLHGLADDFVPSWMTRASYDACTGEKTLLEVEGADHGCSYLVEPARCQAALEDFLERHMP